MRFLIARADKHMWEEPVISGTKGSGTIFFGGCSLRCAFCQNYEISHSAKGLRLTENQLICLMLYLQDRGAHNINLVTPSHYAAALAPVLTKAKSMLRIPIIYNSSGYDQVTDLRRLSGLIDVYLPDLKYYNSELSQKYSGKADYFNVASKAIEEMRRQQPCDCFLRISNGLPDESPNGFSGKLIKRGVIVRHLILPNCVFDSIKALDFLAGLDKSLYVSLMAQYFPTGVAQKFPELNRRLTALEYDTVYRHFFKTGLRNGFIQDRSSAIEGYVPKFDLEKLKADVSVAEKEFAKCLT